LSRQKLCLAFSGDLLLAARRHACAGFHDVLKHLHAKLAHRGELLGELLIWSSEPAPCIAFITAST
jgi:hypothetical protein